ncbi:MAG: S-adenosylmethionine:tRNA ribosyltransferase-isomerase [Gloeobacteraceae cyanobacterium ES-bin-316]|nr:S-adenosylmethionine:tRNA ribosyltransferase-isomerase [Ferruginibacter sp.]
MNPYEISIQDYFYHLPEEKIALHPLTQRDASKLLVYNKGTITENTFADIHTLLPQQSLLVFNNTRVINARIRFKKKTGAAIEVFCLEPLGDINEYSSVMAATSECKWKCLVGGAAKWKEEVLEKELLINDEPVFLKAAMKQKLSEAYRIHFSWNPAHYSFAAVIEAAGQTPLPPYIKRNTDEEDTSRYQTIFAKEDGSVAAPTAGLHFTDSLFSHLQEKNIGKTFVTLHVGAGTFKPVKAVRMQEHEMHAEYIDVDEKSLSDLQDNIGKITAVGTTSLRTLESLYWLGVKAHLYPQEKQLSIKQWDVYEEPFASTEVSPAAAIDALRQWMQRNDTRHIFTQTQLLITPGYQFRIANMLITNFHQPQSTLLLLVAAAVGDDWKKMYAYALENNFRFLSYGDANLIFDLQDRMFDF